MVGGIEDAEKKGIIPRIVDDIFNHVRNNEKKKIFHIKVSYFEIYMNKISDLLDGERNKLLFILIYLFYHE